MSEFRQKCIGKTNLVGSFAAIPHPVAVEVMASSGLDFLCIDWEHAQISRETIEAMVRAADVPRVPAMVRVPGHAPEAIQAALDSGSLAALQLACAEQLPTLKTVLRGLLHYHLGTPVLRTRQVMLDVQSLVP